MFIAYGALYSKANKAFQYTKYTQYTRFTIMKHNISITMDQKLFREIENTRGREKRSTFIEHLIITGLQTYKKEEIVGATKMPTRLLNSQAFRYSDYSKPA
jgi:hypothetical protein